ncbi:cytochrome c biogenesis protein DipZ [Pseudomonas sp. 21LCFQ02]|uniref:cytochrome c biogenesis protein DipZ n=1 Tax=Pseudomonas sp. 21LCFQ02 TaxID=2957505 RepID=UPI00209A661E|nr:cytochrome c biogenesis protein DipZ [Pseudomonas sp. 21LCFQ02]MCO8169237.1 cytochrome c biogenesis protein DipZ [Pseudomonas sp. 21LCFQ02]
MLLLTLAYLGGLLTILSPCILPVLPFVFARGGRPLLRNGLPLLAGMALTFALVATLAAVGGAWVVRLNQYGRWLALAFITLFALTLLLPQLAERLTRPLVAAGNRLNAAAGHDQQPRAGTSLLIGIATGLLWAPCAGPILGLVLTGAALQGANIGSSLLLLAYAAGAATSLGLALLVGGKLFEAIKRGLGAGEWLRRGLGAVMLVGVAAIASGLDTGLLTRLSTATTAGLEQHLVDRLTGQQDDGAMMMRATDSHSGELPVEGNLPALEGAVQWLNSPPLSAEALKGKVVLVDFWTYSCINCLRSLPYVKAWAEKYRDQGLVVIGVHAPEFAFERDIDNVKKASRDLGITYPVAIDNDFAIWKGFNNQYWPAHYFIDGQGKIRYHHFGEGRYDESERVIQQLLREAGQQDVASGMVKVAASGAQQAATQGIRSPETYLGYDRTRNFISSGGVQKDRIASYNLPGSLKLNDWGLSGAWQVNEEQAVLAQAGGHIAYRFKARDLHLVLGPSADGKPVRFKVSIDGKAPGEAHGVDIDADGNGTVNEQRLYQLLRVPGDAAEHSFDIEFLDPGVHAYAFTFG